VRYQFFLPFVLIDTRGTESGIQALNASMPSTSSAPLTRRTIYDRLHYLLRHLLSLIPTLPSTLQSLLVRFFPHKRQNHIAQTTYVRNLLRVSSYCPELSDKILATIVDRAIQIDVWFRDGLHS
jgi:RNA polymerase I-specific transcription initiation factor RRN3